jgi:hypothetical protein
MLVNVSTFSVFSHRAGGAQKELYWLLTVGTWKQDLDNNLVLGDRHVSSWRGGVRTLQFLISAMPTWCGLAVGTLSKISSSWQLQQETHLVVANSPWRICSWALNKTHLVVGIHQDVAVWQWSANVRSVCCQKRTSLLLWPTRRSVRPSARPFPRQRRVRATAVLRRERERERVIDGRESEYKRCVAHMIMKTLGSACLLLLEIRWQKRRPADKMCTCSHCLPTCLAAPSNFLSLTQAIC